MNDAEMPIQFAVTLDASGLQWGRVMNDAEIRHPANLAIVAD